MRKLRLFSSFSGSSVLQCRSIVVVIAAMILPTFATESIALYKCKDSPFSQWQFKFNLRSYPFDNYNLDPPRIASLQFEITSGKIFPGCKKDFAQADYSNMETVSYYFDETAESEEDRPNSSYLISQVFIGPNAMLYVNRQMYRMEEYCFFDYREGSDGGNPTVMFKYCKFGNCSVSKGDRPCVKKCCPYGQSVLRTVDGELAGCAVSSDYAPGIAWNGSFYDEQSWKRLSKAEEAELKPHYIYSLVICPNNPNPPEPWFTKTMLKPMPIDNSTVKQIVDKKQAVRLLSDGRLMYVSGTRRWTILKEDTLFCIDGLLQEEQIGDEFYKNTAGEWSEDNQFVLVCSDGWVPPKQREQSNLYMYSLFIASLFYFLTAIIHLLLWEKQNVNGWTIVCLTLSQGLMCIFMGNAHRLGLDGSADIRDSWVCKGNAILGHYFNLAAFTWLTLMNYNIWSAFRTLSPRSDTKHFKRLCVYLVLGFGGPLVVVGVGLTLEHLYPDNDSLVIVPDYGHNICFVAEWAQGVYIYYILTVLFAIIFLLFFMTCFKIYKLQKDTEHVRSQSSAKDRKSARLYANLSVVLGVSWVFELISWAVTKEGQSWIWIIPDLYNLLTSVFVFLIFGCKPSVIRQMEQKFPFLKPCSQFCGNTIATLTGKGKSTFTNEQTSGVTGISTTGVDKGSRMELQAHGSIVGNSEKRK